MGLNGVIVAERTDLSASYFDQLQQQAVLNCNLSMVPVGGDNDAARILIAMVCCIQSFTILSALCVRVDVEC